MMSCIESNYIWNSHGVSIEKGFTSAAHNGDGRILPSSQWQVGSTK
jgi:hypothetical protein